MFVFAQILHIPGYSELQQFLPKDCCNTAFISALLSTYCQQHWINEKQQKLMKKSRKTLKP